MFHFYISFFFLWGDSGILLMSIVCICMLLWCGSIRYFAKFFLVLGVVGLVKAANDWVFDGFGIKLDFE